MDQPWELVVVILIRKCQRPVLHIINVSVLKLFVETNIICLKLLFCFENFYYRESQNYKNK